MNTFNKVSVSAMQWILYYSDHQVPQVRLLVAGGWSAAEEVWVPQVWIIAAGKPQMLPPSVAQD
jgi:hypothetical protein